MELKVGMYVITNDRMKIGKIKGFCTCEMCEKRGFYEPIIDEDIIITDYDKSQGFHGYKLYDNPIDLIEVGDYVNGYKVVRIFTNVFNNKKVLICSQKQKEEDFDYSDDISDYMSNEFIHIYNEDIKSIVTKEQFASVKYEVE